MSGSFIHISVFNMRFVLSLSFVYESICVNGAAIELDILPAAKLSRLVPDLRHMTELVELRKVALTDPRMNWKSSILVDVTTSLAIIDQFIELFQ